MLSVIILTLVTLCVVILGVVTLSVVITGIFMLIVTFFCSECCLNECHYAERRYSWFHYVVSHFLLIRQSVVSLSALMLNVVARNVQHQKSNFVFFKSSTFRLKLFCLAAANLLELSPQLQLLLPPVWSLSQSHLRGVHASDYAAHIVNVIGIRIFRRQVKFQFKLSQQFLACMQIRFRNNIWK